MKVLGVIPARGGSKGVPRKNIRLLFGKPLLAYTAESALKSTKLSKVVLSTEDEEIAEVGRQCGLIVPFLRPVALAQDTTPTLPVIKHVIQQLESDGEMFDAVCLLQPTNPIRRTVDIDNCIKLLWESGADSVVSVLPVPHEYNPKWVYWKDENDKLSLSTGDVEPITRRQELPVAYHRDGSVYVTQREVVMRKGSLYGTNTAGYQMPAKYSLNIDTEADWQAAERAVSHQLQQKK